MNVQVGKLKEDLWVIWHEFYVQVGPDDIDKDDEIYVDHVGGNAKHHFTSLEVEEIEEQGYPQFGTINGKIKKEIEFKKNETVWYAPNGVTEEIAQSIGATYLRQYKSYSGQAWARARRENPVYVLREESNKDRNRNYLYAHLQHSEYKWWFPYLVEWNKTDIVRGGLSRL